jgi:hypothetical protein
MSERKKPKTIAVIGIGFAKKKTPKAKAKSDK